MTPQDDQNSPDPIPFDDADDESIPLTLDDASAGQAPAGGKLQPISLEDGPEDADQFTSSKIRTFESQSGLTGPAQHEFKRPLNTTGRGATRIRTFHTKLNDAAFRFLDGQINDWIDANPGVEIKFSNTTIGTVEGKRPEPQVIISVWY